jgi:hypothetical protein
MLIDIKINFKDSRNMRILSFLLKVTNYKTKQSYVVILTQTIRLTS